MNLQLEIAIKIFLAFIAGITIGLNREKHKKIAGVRTQMLICIGSALLASISIHLKDLYYLPETTVRIDPARLMAQIVSGIGFIGGGVILKTKQRIIGVTTAATLWVSSAIGIAIGAGFYLPAVLTTILVLSIEPIAHFQYKYGLKSNPFILKVNKKNKSSVISILQTLKIKIKKQHSYNHAVILTIMSSLEKNQKLSVVFQQKKIKFKLEEVSLFN